MAVVGLLIFAAFLIAAAASDLGRYRVPNALTLIEKLQQGTR